MPRTVCIRCICGNGEKVDEKRVISSVSRCINPYRDYEAFLEAACSPALEMMVSNTTEAGIVFDPSAKLEDRPCLSFPGKLTQALYARFKKGLPGVVILSCELIDNNGKELLHCVNRHIEVWKLDEAGSWTRHLRNTLTKRTSSAIPWSTVLFPAA